jgi:putative hemin transport protein
MTTTTRPENLRAAWRELEHRRKVRNRDAAELLGVSEAELIASACGDGATRLAGDARRVLGRVPEMGRAMALTRNAACVHEKTGVYENLSIDAMVGLALGKDIDLRLFYRHWVHAFAVENNGLASLQFFDAAGDAVHKVFLKDGADHGAYQRIAADFADADQRPGLEVAARGAPKSERPDTAIDADGLRRAWSTLQDTHDFFGLLKRFDVTRTQALRLAGYEFAQAVDPAGLRTLLEDAATRGLAIMVFVGNPGCIQIHTGPVHRIVMHDAWLNVMDPGFNLHLRTDLVKAAWIVRKPTADGIVTSLELFDATGDTIAMLFGERKPGVAELPAWREALARVFPAAQA